jgi:YVTN family beta-propeller protein
MSIDDRARRWAQATQDAVAHTSPPPLRQRRPRPVLRYAPSLAVLAALVGGLVLVRNATEDTIRYSARVVATIPVGRDPAALTTGAGSVWVTDSSDATVLRIDPRTNAVTATIAVGGDPSGVVVFAGSVWVASRADGTVSRIDPARNRVVATVRTGAIDGISAGAGGVWTIANGDRSLTRIDPRTNTTSSFALDFAPVSVATSDDAVWIADAVSRNVGRFDPDAGRVVTTVLFHGQIDIYPLYLIAGRDGVWAGASYDLGFEAAGITHADADSLEITWFAKDYWVRNIAVGAGGVWALGDTGGNEALLYVEVGRVARLLQLRSTPRDIAAGEGAVWLLTTQRSVVRVDVTRR